MKTVIFILVLAVGGYYAFRAGYIKREWFDGSASTASSSSAGAASADSLEKSLNRGLPRMVSNEISVDRVVANNVQMVFNYRLVDLDQFAATQRYGSSMPAEMKDTLVRDICANRELREQVLSRGRDVQIQVHSQDGSTVYSSQLRAGGC